MAFGCMCQTIESHPQSRQCASVPCVSHFACDTYMSECNSSHRRCHFGPNHLRLWADKSDTLQPTSSSSSCLVDALASRRCSEPRISVAPSLFLADMSTVGSLAGTKRKSADLGNAASSSGKQVRAKAAALHLVTSIATLWTLRSIRAPKVRVIRISCSLQT